MPAIPSLPIEPYIASSTAPCGIHFAALARSPSSVIRVVLAETITSLTSPTTNQGIDPPKYRTSVLFGVPRLPYSATSTRVIRRHVAAGRGLSTITSVVLPAHREGR